LATRRMASRRTITGSMSEMQRRLRYLEGRPSPSRLSNHVVTRTTIQPRAVDSDQIALDAVTNDQVAANAISNEQLQDNSVGTQELIADSVTSEELADDSVLSNNIGSDQVGNTEIASDSVGTSELQDLSVTTDKLDTEAVTNEKIADNAISEDKIPDGEIKTRHLASEAVTEAKLAQDAVTTEKIKDETILGWRHIAPNTIVNSRLADNIISNRTIQNSAVQTANIQNSAVTSAKLATGSVTNSKLATGAVTGVKISDGTINASKTDGTILTYLVGSRGISAVRLPAGRGFSVSANFGSSSNTVAVGNHTHGQYTTYGHSHFVNLSGGAHGHFGASGAHGHSATSGQASSVRYKKDISNHELSNLEKILKLKTKKFKYKNKYRDLNRGQDWQYGIIAEEAEGLGLKEIIEYDAEGRPDRINFGVVSLYALQLIKQQQDEIDLLKTQVARLMETK
jgi:hypothetical protein